MNSIKVLDVTLRDGGCVNNFNFGHNYMDKILKAQEQSRLDIIEVGYLDENKGTEIDRTQWISVQAISRALLKKKNNNIKYVAMIDLGKFDVRNLPTRTSTTIDGIRLAFHKKDVSKIVEVCKIILEKGYELFIQPMITLRYSDKELLDLVTLVNEKLSCATAFYIVDSFGEMRADDIRRVVSLIDHNLKQQMPIGFHSHNNLQLSYSNACAILNFATNREIILDSSILGMGKGAGNLNTELLLEHLNIFFQKRYSISPLLEVIDEVLNQIRSEFYWGYSPEFYLSAVHHCTPSYATHFYSKHMLPISQVGELLGQIAEDKKISFDKEYAEKLWRTFKATNQCDDSAVLSELKQKIQNKTVILVAPGKSLSEYNSLIKEIIANKSTISISLNIIDNFDTTYFLITRKELYNLSLNSGKKIITTSRIANESSNNVKTLNYEKWIEVHNGLTYDSSSIIAFNLIKECGANEICLAGFDGFSSDINENYYSQDLRHPVTSQQAKERNKFYKEYINVLKKSGIKVTFLTPSKYA